MMSCVCVSLSFSGHHLHPAAAEPGLHHRLECQVHAHLVTNASACSSGGPIFIQQVFSGLNGWLLAVAGRSCCSVESSTQRRTCTWASWPSPSSPRAPRRGSTGKSLTLMPAVFLVTHTGLSRRCSLQNNLVHQQKPDSLMLLKIISPDFPAACGVLRVILSFLTYVEDEWASIFRYLRSESLLRGELGGKPRMICHGASCAARVHAVSVTASIVFSPTCFIHKEESNNSLLLACGVALLVIL